MDPLIPSAPPQPTMVPSSTQQPQGVISSGTFREQTQYEEGFANFYEYNVKPKVRELETLRTQKFAEIEKNRPKAKLIYIGCIVLGIAGTVIFRNLGFLMVLWVAGYFIKTGMIGSPKNDFRNEIKAKILPEVIKFFGEYKYKNEKENYDEKEAFSEIIENSKLFNGFTSSNFDDTISGKYRGKNMQFSEVTLVNRSGKSSTTVFQGKIIILETNKMMTGTVIIKQESQKGIMNKLMGKDRGLSKVNIPDSHFEETFEVYSDDQNIPMTLVTPDFIQSLLKVNQQQPGAYIRCSFFQNFMVVALANNTQKPDSNLFEMSTMEGPIMEDIHKYLAQFHGILEILDTLNIIKKT